MALRCFSAIAMLAFAAVLFPARADDADAVKERLFQAKKEYDAETQKFKKAVGDLLDKREDDARKVGNKKLVDQVKAERAAFEQVGESPTALPTTFLTQVKSARAKLDKAYQVAVKDFVKVKDDSAAEATEKEQEKFLLESAFIVGKRTHLSSLKPFDVSAYNNWFEKDTDKYKMGMDPVPHSVFMHPNFKGIATASYLLPIKVFAFRAVVGVPKHQDAQADPDSPITFEVLADGKSLWKSESVAKIDTFQTCTLKIEKTKTLILRVNCPQSHGRAHAVWFAPILVE